MFTDSQTCKSRVHCLFCRNSENFRKDMLKTHGGDSIECPLGVAEGAKLADFPEVERDKIVAAMDSHQISRPSISSIAESANKALSLLYINSPAQWYPWLDAVTAYTFPAVRSIDTCRHSGEVIGEESFYNPLTMKDESLLVRKCDVVGTTNKEKCRGCQSYGRRPSADVPAAGPNSFKLLSCRLHEVLWSWLKTTVVATEELKSTELTPEGLVAANKISAFLDILDAEMSNWNFKVGRDVPVDSVSGDVLMAKIRAAVAKLGTPSNLMEVSKCIHRREQDGTKSQVCCGGKIKEIPKFKCKLRTDTTDRECLACPVFLPRVDTPVITCDLLVTSLKCDECDAIEATIVKSHTEGRILNVVQLATDESARAYLDIIGRSDLYTPALLTGFCPTDKSFEASFDGFEDVIGEMDRLGYVKVKKEELPNG